MNRKTVVVLIITAFIVFIFCLMLSKISLDKIEQNKTVEITVAEDDTSYSFYNETIKLNNVFYNGKPLLLDNNTGIVYFPASELYLIDDTAEERINGNVVDCVVIYKDEKYISFSSMENYLGYNIFQDQNELWYIDNFETFDYSWVSGNRVVAHALGGVDSRTYTDCEEALVCSYERGCRVFEVDFLMTSDGVPVLGHDWKKFYKITGRNGELPSDGSQPPALSYEEYVNSVIYNEYTPLTVERLAEYMVEYPDMYIITDTKSVEDPDVSIIFNSISNILRDKDESILDRVIPQIYNNEMLNIIMKVYDWKSVVYTLYNLPDNLSYDDVFNFAYENGIRVITCSSSRGDYDFINEINMIGGHVYMHTINEVSVYNELMEKKGIYGIYSDFISPCDI